MPLTKLYHAIPTVSTKIIILRISLAASRPAGRTRTGRPFPRKLERKKAPPFYPTRRSLFAFFRFAQSGFPVVRLPRRGVRKINRCRLPQPRTPAPCPQSTGRRQHGTCRTGARHRKKRRPLRESPRAQSSTSCLGPKRPAGWCGE